MKKKSMKQQNYINDVLDHVYYCLNQNFCCVFIHGNVGETDRELRDICYIIESPKNKTVENIAAKHTYSYIEEELRILGYVRGDILKVKKINLTKSEGNKAIDTGTFKLILTIDDYKSKSHLKSVGYTYFQHLGRAFSVGSRMIVGGTLLFIHGIIPNIFRRSGSNCIKKLYDELYH